MLSQTFIAIREHRFSFSQKTDIVAYKNANIVIKYSRGVSLISCRLKMSRVSVFETVLTYVVLWVEERVTAKKNYVYRTNGCYFP